MLHTLRANPSQAEQGRGPQWNEQQRRRQPEIEQGRELSAQLQRWKQSILRRLCGLEQVNLDAMNPHELKEYAKEELEDKVRNHPQRGTNLRRLVTNASEIQMHVQQRLENTVILVDKLNLESAWRKASRGMQKGLEAMKPEQLKEYTQKLKQKMEDHLRMKDYSNLERLSTIACEIEICAQKRLINRPNERDRIDLENVKKTSEEIRQQVIGVMGTEQLNKCARLLNLKWEILAHQMRSGEILGQLWQQADNLHEHMDLLSRRGRFQGSDFQNQRDTAKIITEVKLSIDEMQINELTQRVQGVAAAQEPQDRTLLQQLRQEAEKLQERGRIALNYDDQELREPIRRNEDITVKADKLITLLRRLELPTMNPKELKTYAEELEEKALQLPEGTNLGQREPRKLEQLMTRALDVQEHMQQQLENRQDWAGRRDLESAGRKTSRSIEVITNRSEIENIPLQNMSSLQLSVYAKLLERQVLNSQPQRSERTNLEQRAKQLNTELIRREWFNTTDRHQISAAVITRNINLRLNQNR